MSLSNIVKRFIHSHGSEVNIFKNDNNTDTPDKSIRALKNSKKDTKAVIFQFEKPQDIFIGDIINQVGARDRWVVTDTEDNIIQGKYSHFEVAVKKEGSKSAAEPLTPLVIPQTVYNLNAPNSRVNNHSSDNSTNIQINNHQKSIELVNQLKEEVNKLPIDQSLKNEAIDAIGIIENQFRLEKPNKTIVKSMLDGVLSLLPDAANIATIASAIMPLFPS